MPKTEFDHLLHRYLTGQVSEAEKAKIEAWLEIKKTDKTIADKLTAEEEGMLFKKITSNIDKVEDIRSFQPRGESHPSFFSNRSIRMAATIVLLLTGSVAIFYLTGKYTSANTIASADGQKTTLADGTIVWLQKGSKVIYTENLQQKTRNVILEGGGLFEVAKDSTRPFLIVCNDVTAKVLGTSFSLKKKGEGIELMVLTGHVNLSSAFDQKGVNVGFRETVTYLKSGKSDRAALAQNEIDRITANTGYDMKFENEQMALVFQKIREKFGIETTIENAQINGCRITADFTDRSLDTTMNMLAALLDLKFSIDGKTVAVSGNGCK